MPTSNDGPDVSGKPDPADETNTMPRLALRPKEACVALSIGPRLLWSMTNRGEIPHVRIGRAVVYPVDELRRWLSEQAQKKVLQQNLWVDSGGTSSAGSPRPPPRAPFPSAVRRAA